MVNANITPFERKYDINNQYGKNKVYKCNLCNAEFDSSKYDGNMSDILSRHEDWHDESLPYVAKNKIGGKVEWILE